MKNKSILAIPLFAVFGVFVVLFPVQAQSTMGWTATIFSSLAQIIIELVGKLLIVLIEILLAVVKYNDFINADAVKRGWILVRDFSNMAFLIIFIGIAFATILGVEKYEWKRLLPKLLIMAVVINFSKTICGILIDASQVVMITFVNGFKDVAAGNLIRGFGLSDMLSIRDLGADESITDSAIAGASVLAVVLLLIAAVVVGIIVFMFMARILMLWILIVLSPIAFMLSAAPGGDAQFQKWFRNFVKYAFMGPLLAFFLWLSFSVMAGVSPGSNLAQSNNIPFGETKTGILEPAGNTSAAISGISRSDQLLSYFIAIGLLVMSLMVAQSLGVAGSSMAGDALSKIKSGGVKLAKLGALAGLTGGLGVPGLLAGKRAAGAGYDWMTKDKTKRGALAKFLGRRADDKVSPGLTKGLARAGAAVAGRFGMKDTQAGLEKFSQGEGLRLRVVKQAWKDRQAQREGEKVAESRGGTRDLLNKVIDGKNTDYESRERTKLVNESSKIQLEGDNSTSTFVSTAQTGDINDSKGAMMNLMAKSSFDVLSTTEENNKATIEYFKEGTKRLEERWKYLEEGGFKKEDESIDKEIELVNENTDKEIKLANKNTDKEIKSIDDNKSLSPEQKIDKKKKLADLKIEEEERLNEQGRTKIDKLKSRKSALGKEYGSLESDIQKNKDYTQELIDNKARDTTAHRWVYVRDKFGDTSSTAEFFSQLVGIARKNGEIQGHGSVKKDMDTQMYKVADFATPEGRREQVKSMSGRAGHQDANETMKASGTVYRDRIIDKNGKERLSDITESGIAQLQNMSGNIDNRNIRQITPEAFAAMLKGMYSNYKTERIGLAGDESAIKELDKKFAATLWDGLEDVKKKNILGSDDLGYIKTRLENFVHFDKAGSPITKQAAKSVADEEDEEDKEEEGGGDGQAQNQEAKKVKDELVASIDQLSGHIDNLANNNEVTDASSANKAADSLQGMLEKMADTIQRLSGQEKGEADKMSSEIEDLVRELRSVSGSKDEDEQKLAIDNLNKRMLRSNEELKNILRRIQL